MIKILKYLFLIISTWLVLGTVDFLFNISGRLGHGYYIEMTSARTLIKHKNIKQLSLSNILLWKYNDRYIVLARDKEHFFDCKNRMPVYREGLRYTLIDKLSNHITETDTYKKFQQKLHQQGIELIFSDKEIKQIQSMMIHKKPQNSRRLDDLLKRCKEDFNWR